MLPHENCVLYWAPVSDSELPGIDPFPKKLRERVNETTRIWSKMLINEKKRTLLSRAVSGTGE